jgi:hypothetical protein
MVPTLTGQPFSNIGLSCLRRATGSSKNASKCDAACFCLAKTNDKVADHTKDIEGTDNRTLAKLDLLGKVLWSGTSYFAIAIDVLLALNHEDRVSF